MLTNVNTQKSMGRRIATYTLAFLFLVSSVAYACPGVYRLPSHDHHSSVNKVAPEHDPCGDTNNDASHSGCHQALHHRRLNPATEFSFAGGQENFVLADEIFLAPESLSFSYLSTIPYQPPPEIALTLLYHVIRI